MNLLFMIIKEAISIIEMLSVLYGAQNDRIIVERDKFKEALEKFPYASFAQKVKVYKAINLLIHDKGNYTLPYKDKELKKTVRKVIINHMTFQVIKEMHNIAIEK